MELELVFNRAKLCKLYYEELKDVVPRKKVGNFRLYIPILATTDKVDKKILVCLYRDLKTDNVMAIDINKNELESYSVVKNDNW